jgi:glutamate-5-semialdehyde dehydrogenase
MLPLTLAPGMVIPFGGDRATVVGEDLAAAFAPGDRLVVVQTTGDLLHVPRAVWELSRGAVDQAVAAFAALARCSDDDVSRFYARFASQLDDDAVFALIRNANDRDIAVARAKGRSTTRLELTERMRADMVSGLRGWIEFPPTRDRVVRRIDHDGWSVEQRLAGLGVVGFVFEGRPNVFADACGLLRSGNTIVMRIGSDALGTARAVMTHALSPALAEAGLPDGAVVLVDSVERSAGWAMFADSRLALAVARGSGPAVAQLGAVARQSGVAVSLHGTGGAWLVAGEGCSRRSCGGRSIARSATPRTWSAWCALARMN